MKVFVAALLAVGFCLVAADEPATGPSGLACEVQGKCVNQPDGAMFKDDSSTGYIVCQCQCQISMPCPENTQFDEEKGVCDWISITGGGNNPGESTPGGSTPGGSTPGGSTPGGSTPGDNTDGGSNTICDDTVAACQRASDGTLVNYDGVCNKFYSCMGGCGIEQSCPNNLHFDAIHQICDYPENVGCTWNSTPPSGPDAGPSGIACPSGGRCVGKPNGTFLPSTTSCSEYVVCQCECEVDMACSEGLYWDSVLDTCNFPGQVVCNL